MPIDLTKPIRRKNGPLAWVSNGPVYQVSVNAQVSFATLSDLERDYENIPEQRKPREFSAFERNGVLYPMDLLGGARTRVIEWPEGAPLPDLPTP